MCVLIGLTTHLHNSVLFVVSLYGEGKYEASYIFFIVFNFIWKTEGDTSELSVRWYTPTCPQQRTADRSQELSWVSHVGSRHQLVVPCLQGSYQRSWDSNQARRSSVLRGLKEATEGEHRSGSVTGCCYATVVFLSMCMCTHIQHTRTAVCVCQQSRTWTDVHF